MEILQHKNGTKYVILVGGAPGTQLLNVDSINEGWHSGIKFLQRVKTSIKTDQQKTWCNISKI